MEQGFDIGAIADIRQIYPDHTLDYNVNTVSYGYGKKSIA
jgi:hypothetical protein